ncbi:3-phenylpropionate/cinnamic acid dioxygenase subunit beta [Pinisolibacter sp.]|uniref:3-phenylpropionate/cinnamic acid dioxygenase subunit beta n=1 Tax=Pinisolibacter sp. TaxID=2172024 RepID=UPI002FDE6A88
MNQLAQKIAPLSAPAVDLVVEIQQVLYREARLLDAERYDEWVEMLAPDLHYFMPNMETRYRADKSNIIADLKRAAYFNDNREDMLKRLDRLKTGTAWSEDPATRFTHLIGNVEVELTETESEYRVYSAFLLCRGRNESDEDIQVGKRKDLWRRTPDGLKLVQRTIHLNQNTLLSKNLNAFL